MAARRCVLHGSYPPDFAFHNCPVCGDKTDYIENAEPDENWKGNVLRMREHLEQAVAPTPDIPVLEGARVKLINGEYFLSTWDVVNGGIRHRLRDTDLVQVGKQVFEILHYSYECRRYLVQPFATELDDDDMRKLQCPDS